MDAGVVALSMIAIFAYSFSYPTLFPEYPWIWSLSPGYQWSDVVARYGEYTGAWYKPTELFAYFWLITKVIDWHDTFGFRVLTLLEFYGLAMLAYWVWRRVFPQDRMAPVIAAVVLVAHPTLFIVVYENLGAVLLYALSVTGSALCFATIDKPAKHPWLLTLCGLVLYAFALTCREQVIALPALLVAWSAIQWLSGNPGAREGWRAKAVFVLSAVALTVAYWYFHVARMNEVSGGYRNVFAWSYVKRNLMVFPEWLFHYFGSPQSSYLLRPNDDSFNVAYAAVLSALLVSYWGFAVWKAGKRALLELALLLTWTLGFLAIPVYAGGEPWHIILPVAGFGALTGVAVSRLGAAVPSPAIGKVLPWAVLVIIAARGAVDFSRQFSSSRPWLYRLNAEALAHPPVAREAMPKGAYVYYDSKGLSDWNYGSGHLFGFVYLDPTLVTRGITPAELDHEVARTWLSARNAYYFTHENQHWSDATAEFNKLALSKVEERLRHLMVAGDVESAEALLAPMLHEHPERAKIRAQLDCLPTLKRRSLTPECTETLGVSFLAPSGASLPAALWRGSNKLPAVERGLVLAGTPLTLVGLGGATDSKTVLAQEGDRVFVSNLGAPRADGSPAGVTMSFASGAWRLDREHAPRDPEPLLISDARPTPCLPFVSSSTGARYRCEVMKDEGGVFWRITALSKAEWLVVTRRLPRSFAGSYLVTSAAQVRAAHGAPLIMHLFDFHEGKYSLSDVTRVGDETWTVLRTWNREPSWEIEDYADVGLAPAAEGASFDLRAFTLSAGAYPSAPP